MSPVVILINRSVGEWVPVGRVEPVNIPEPLRPSSPFAPGAPGAPGVPGAPAGPLGPEPPPLL